MPSRSFPLDSDYRRSQDIGLRISGTLLGISSTFATLSGIIGGAIKPTKWSNFQVTGLVGCTVRKINGQTNPDVRI